VTGAPGLYTLNYSWSATGASSYRVELYQVIQSVTTLAQTTNTTLTSTTYSNLVTGASYYTVVIAYAGGSQTGNSTSATSTSASFYNPFGGPQGVQGIQGIQGLQGAQGPQGTQGPQGLQGLMSLSNHSTTVPNYVTTSTTSSTVVNVNSNLSFNGSTLSVTGNVVSTGAITGLNYTFTNDGSSGMYLPAVSNVAWNTAGVERMRILANGNIGIGRSDPQLLLDVNGSVRFQTINNTGVIYNPDGTTANPSYTFSSDPGTGMFRPALSNLAFTTNGVERMRITSSGALDLGANTIACGAITAPTSTNTINGLIISSGNVSGMGTLSCGAITAPTSTNTINGLLINAGTCTGVDFIATSDQRTKTNITSISNALDIVKELRGVYFTRIGQTKQTVGVIAQEVEAVLPEVVHTDSEGLKSVSYGNMIGVLIEAVKTLSEQLEKIQSLK
jgi:hypothetical protein